MKSLANAPAKAPDLDPVKLESFMQKRREEQSLPLGILGGLFAALIALALWAGIAALTGFNIGLLAIGVGYLVGLGVRIFGRGVTPIFGVIGVILTLLACLVANVLVIAVFLAQYQGMTFSVVIGALFNSPAALGQLLFKSFAWIDILFYALAMFVAYWTSIRRLSKKEKAGLRRAAEQPAVAAPIVVETPEVSAPEPPAPDETPEQPA